MMLGVVLPYEALSEAGSQRALHERLRRVLFTFGIIKNTDVEMRAFKELGNDSPGEWPRWREVLRAMPRVRSSESFERVGPLRRVGPFPTVYILPAPHARRLIGALGGGKDERSLVVEEDSLEIVAADAIDESSLLGQRERWSNERIRAGRSPADVLKMRIGPVCNIATRVTVVDRYILHTLSQQVARGDSTYGPQWCVREVVTNSGSGLYRLEIIGGIPDDDSHPEWAARGHFERLADVVWQDCHDKVDELHIVAVPMRFMRGITHSRDIRIARGEDYRLITLDNSFDCFRPPVFAVDLHFTYQRLLGSENEPFRKRDERLRGLAERGIGIVVRP